MTERIHTAGKWSRDGGPIYFIASSPMTIGKSWREHPHVLIAVNEIKNTADMEAVDEVVVGGGSLLIDSGIFALATGHAKAHGLSMNQALSLAPNKVDGFAELRKRYLEVIDRYGSKAWGYIEMDQGGRENKIKTRTELEALGLRPIPVYHPLNDGWDYFDYLAERYDRICFGNVVMARGQDRTELFATAWERRRKYPHLWIHLLGATPCEQILSWPPDSCDSSTWLNAVRWGSGRVNIGTKTCWALPDGFIYRLADSESWNKAWRFSGYVAHFEEQAMRNYTEELRSCGIDTRAPL